MLVEDVVIHTNEGLSSASQSIDRSAPPFRRFKLADDLWVEKLDSRTVNTVLDSCEPPGFGIRRPTRQFAQLYAFVRQLPEPTVDYSWDGDQRLQTCVALSRLVHPTSVSFRYAARIRYGADGQVTEIVPGPVTGHGAQAFVAGQNHRDQLVAGDLEELKRLVAHAPLSSLPPRLVRALWYHEFAARTEHLDVRWTLVSTALEALVDTEKFSSTEQFKKRVPKLG